MTKKRKLEILILCFLPLGSLFSQSLTIGAFGGPGYTFIRNTDNIKTYPAINYATGLSLDYSFPGKLSLLCMPAFAVKGNSYETKLTDATGTLLQEIKIKENLNYLTLPLLLKGRFGKEIKFVAAIGMHVSYLLGANYTISSNPYGATGASNTDSFTRFDTGGSVILGGECHLSEKVILSLLLSHEEGLSNIAQAGDALHNNATYLLLTVGYVLGKK